MKISDSKPFKNLYDLAVKDKISNKFKKEFILTDDFKVKLSSMKSKMEYDQILKYRYENPSMKIKQLENLFDNLIELQNEFPELKSSESSERNRLLQSAFLLFIEKNNEKARVMIPNPDDCARNCQGQLNLSINSAYNQWMISNVGCILISPSIWVAFVCSGVAGAIYDEQFMMSNLALLMSHLVFVGTVWVTIK